MKRKQVLISAAAMLLAGAAVTVPSIAAAGGNVAWGVSIGGPGFAISAGQPAWGGPSVGAISEAGTWFGGPAVGAVIPVAPIRPRFAQVVVTPPVVYSAWPAPVVVAPVPMFRPRAVAYARRGYIAPIPRYPARYPVARRAYPY